MNGLDSGENVPPRDEGVAATPRTHEEGSERTALAAGERDRAIDAGTHDGRPRASEDECPEVTNQPLQSRIEEVGQSDPGAKDRDGERAERAAVPSLSPEGTIPSTIEDKGRRLDAGRAFEIEVCAAVAKFGANHVALWTSTPGDLNVLGEFEKVMDWREASRRWDSLNSNVISRREEWLRWALVMQRHRDGGVHFHVLVVHRDNIRGDLDFFALRKRDYSSANEALRGEWARWRNVAPRYGFGRCEFLPVYDDAGLGRYLARYLRRELGKRREEDHRAQLFRFSRSWERVVLGDACWADAAAKRSRRREVEIGKRLFGSFERMAAEIPRWRWKLKRLLWCRDALFHLVMLQAEESLKIHDGALLAIDEAFADADKHEAEFAEGERRWNARCAAPN